MKNAFKILVLKLVPFWGDVVVNGSTFVIKIDLGESRALRFALDSLAGFCVTLNLLITNMCYEVDSDSTELIRISCKHV
jgi:hypothetical protein